MIDWRRLLDEYRIPYRDERRNLYVTCPFCGTADGGMHMGISTEGRGWGCWRAASHRGRSPVRLLTTLLRIDYETARRLSGGAQTALTSDEGLAAVVSRNLAARSAALDTAPLRLPTEIMPLHEQGSFAQSLFVDYLVSRGYAERDITPLCERYELRCALLGPFAYRLVFPVRDDADELLTFTGRSIAAHAVPRYLTLSTHADSKLALQGLPLARAAITDMLLQEQRLFNEPCSTLVVCEGPFDAMRIDFACREYDVRATCLFGKQLSDAQHDKLAQLSEYSERKLLLLDPDARIDSFALCDKLSSFQFQLLQLPEGYDDPGDARLSFSAIRKLLQP